MKKKIIALVLTSSLLSSGIAAAAAYHIADAAAQQKIDIKAAFDEYQAEKGEKIKADTSAETQEQIERLQQETWKYYNQLQAADYQGSLNGASNAIEQETDKHIEELKQYIDSLFNVKRAPGDDGQPKG